VVYTLCCRADSGEEVKFYYNPHTSELVDEDADPCIEGVSNGRASEKTPDIPHESWKEIGMSGSPAPKSARSTGTIRSPQAIG
jgi:hypothetical protein